MSEREDAMKKGSGLDRKYIENSIILRTPVICTTLAMAGIDCLNLLQDEVECLLVDEACQCVEPSTLIPFNLNPKRVILVGD